MPIATRQIIEIVTKFTDKARAPIQKLNNVMTESVSGVNAMSQRLGISSRELRANLRAQKIAFQDASVVMKKNVAPLQKLNNVMTEHNMITNRAAKNMGGFNFSWLSVMFAGMALSRVFGGIIRQQMELWGIMEGFSAMLMVVMLPVMETLSEVLWPILTWFMELPEWAKKVIGGFIIFGAVLGAFLTTAGMVMLALNGILPILKSMGIGAGAAAGKVGILITKLKGIAKVFVPVLLFGLALKDAAEGQLIAAVGDVLMAAGFMMGPAGMWLMALGLGLKLIGDEEFLSDVIAMFLKVIDTAIRFGEEIGKALWAGIMGLEYEPPADIGKAVLEGVKKADVKSEILKGIGLTIPEVGTRFGAGMISPEGGYTLGQPITINNAHNYYGFTNDDLKRAIDSSNIRLAEDVRRMIQT